MRLCSEISRGQKVPQIMRENPSIWPEEQGIERPYDLKFVFSLSLCLAPKADPLRGNV